MARSRRPGQRTPWLRRPLLPAEHRIGLGLVLLVTFSLGLAATLTALGLLVVYARRATAKLPAARRLASSRAGAALPSLSTLLILGLGVLLTVRALPDVM